MLYEWPHTIPARYSPGFKSVEDWHFNRLSTKREVVQPVEGGEESVLREFDRLGFSR
jgi:hypothetical protein